MTETPEATSRQPLPIVLTMANVALLTIAWMQEPVAWRHVVVVLAGLVAGASVAVRAEMLVMNVSTFLGFIAAAGWFFHPASRSASVMAMLGSAASIVGSQIPFMLRSRGERRAPSSGIALLIELLVFVFFVLPFLLRR